MPNGVNRVTGLTFDTGNFKSEYSIEDPELKELVNSAISAKKHHKKKGATSEKNAAAVDNKA